jgi:transposase-like protein
MIAEPKSLQEAIIHFADFENCKAFMIELRWPDGKVKCPRCGAEKVTWLEKTRVWKCYAKHEPGNGQTFTLKTGTIFEDSPIPLEKWLPAFWLVVNCKNGISSYEMGRDLEISQKSAWHMDHRIRFALHQGSFEKFSGHIEADETFIGGKARNMHKAKRARRITGTGGKDKTAVIGILERGKDGKTSRIRTQVIPNRKKKAIQAEVRKHVEAGSALYSDALASYQGLDEFQHQVIDHAVAYVDGQTHTNNCENFWSLLKRSIAGTYVSVEPFHLFRYLDEQAFRYNNRRDMTDFDRFKLALSHAVGKRLTWNQLTGKQPDYATCSN